MKKKINIFLFMSVLISVGLSILYYNSIQKIEKIDIKEYKNLKIEKEHYLFNIDNVEKVRNTLFIEGWVLEIDKDNKYINSAVVIKDASGSYYKFFTKSISRPDVNDSFGGKYDYLNTGIIAKGKLKKSIKYPIKIYILKRNKDESILIDTNKNIE